MIQYFYIYFVIFFIHNAHGSSVKSITLTDAAKNLHASSLVWDAHNDLPLQLLLRQDQELKRFDLSKLQKKMQTDIPRLRKGGVKAQFWSANPFDFPKLHLPRPFLITNSLIDIVHRFSEFYPAHFEFSRTARDVKSAFLNGKIASLIGIEGGNAIENSLDNLRHFYTRGVRYMTLTHFANNEIADSATDKEAHGGLSSFGKEVVKEMNRLGMLIDISHTSTKTMQQVLKLSRSPVLFSHAGAYGVTPNKRNVSDEILKVLPSNGGVVAAIFCSRYLRADGKNGTIHDFLDHLDHLVNTAGIDHVGIGSDLEGDLKYPTDLNSVDDFVNITQGLLDRGYKPEAIQKILGLNLLRIFEAVSP